jgi:hypothetical protein
LAFIAGVPSPAVSDRTYRYLPAFLPRRQTGRRECFRLPDIAFTLPGDFPHEGLMYRPINRLLRRPLPPMGHEMKVASEPVFQLRDLSGPAVAVLITLAGAALVAVGLLLVGTRDATRVGMWAPPTSFSVTASD